MDKPHSISAADHDLISPPEGVTYAGARSVPPFLVLRFVDDRTRQEDRITYRAYCDRYYDVTGKEIFRETGEIASPLPWYRRWFL